MKRLHLLIHGEVQGVFFRNFAKKTADSLELTGWARNNPDGTVEILAEGDEANLKELMKKCKKGPSAAKVEKIKEKWEETAKEFKNFQIKRCVHSTLRLASGIGHIQIYQKSVRILKTSLGAMHIHQKIIFK